MNMDSIFLNLCIDFKDFLPRRFRFALKELKTLTSLKILPADKGGKNVLMDKHQYDLKMKTILSDKQVYRNINSNHLPSMQRNFNRYLLTIITNHNNNKDKDLDFLKHFTSYLPSLPYIY